MRARNADQRARNIDNATGNFVALIIDEMSTFTAKPSGDAKHPDNKLHARFLDELAMVARRGRSTGIRLFVTAQEPVAEQIPPTIRANCLNTISFKLPIDAHATALFGQLEGLPADPRHLQRGRALLKNGVTGEIRHVQFPVMGTPR
jgi:DNA segregation ATPase FtsK/SpoIIIE-like protein